MALLQELERLDIQANLDSRTGRRDEMSFTVEALRRCQTFQTRRTDPGLSSSDRPGITPRHVVQLLQSVNADPVMRSLSRSLSQGRSNRSAAGDRISGSMAPLPIHEEEPEGEHLAGAQGENGQGENLLTPSLAIAHITLDQEDQQVLFVEETHLDGQITRFDEETVVVEEFRSSYTGRTSRLARVTSRRISEAGNSVIVLTIPQAPTSQSNTPQSGFECAADLDISHSSLGDFQSERPSISKSGTPRNPWAPLSGPPMSDTVAKRVAVGTQILQTLDSFKLPSTIRHD